MYVIKKCSVDGGSKVYGDHISRGRSQKTKRYEQIENKKDRYGEAGLLRLKKKLCNDKTRK